MEAAQMRKLDKRIENQEQKKQQNPSETAPKGRKRQIEGQGNISSFFQQNGGLKRQKSSESKNGRSQPLRELSNLAECRGTTSSSNTASSSFSSSSSSSAVSFLTARQSHGLSTHRPLSTPMYTRPSYPTSSLRSRAVGICTPEDRENHDDDDDDDDHNRQGQKKYLFLSSSPAKPLEEEGEKEEESLPQDEKSATDNDNNSVAVNASGFRPASTFHSTSMQQEVQPRRQKTLGVRRSMNGWAARMNR